MWNSKARELEKGTTPMAQTKVFRRGHRRTGEREPKQTPVNNASLPFAFHRQVTTRRHLDDDTIAHYDFVDNLESFPALESPISLNDSVRTVHVLGKRELC